MLQPHQLLAEYEAVISEEERKKLKDGAFEDVIRAAQVTPPFNLSLHLHVAISRRTCGIIAKIRMLI